MSIVRIATCVKECGAAILLPQNVIALTSPSKNMSPNNLGRVDADT